MAWYDVFSQHGLPRVTPEITATLQQAAQNPTQGKHAMGRTPPGTPPNPSRHVLSTSQPAEIRTTISTSRLQSAPTQGDSVSIRSRSARTGKQPAPVAQAPRISETQPPQKFVGNWNDRFDAPTPSKQENIRLDNSALNVRERAGKSYSTKDLAAKDQLIAAGKKYRATERLPYKEASPVTRAAHSITGDPPITEANSSFGKSPLMQSIARRYGATHRQEYPARAGYKSLMREQDIAHQRQPILPSITASHFDLNHQITPATKMPLLSAPKLPGILGQTTSEYTDLRTNQRHVVSGILKKGMPTTNTSGHLLTVPTITLPDSIKNPPKATEKPAAAPAASKPPSVRPAGPRQQPKQTTRAGRSPKKGPNISKPTKRPTGHARRLAKATAPTIMPDRIFTPPPKETLSTTIIDTALTETQRTAARDTERIVSKKAINFGMAIFTAGALTAGGTVWKMIQRRRQLNQPVERNLLSRFAKITAAGILGGLSLKSIASQVAKRLP